MFTQKKKKIEYAFGIWQNCLNAGDIQLAIEVGWGHIDRVKIILMQGKKIFIYAFGILKNCWNAGNI